MYGDPVKRKGKTFLKKDFSSAMQIASANPVANIVDTVDVTGNDTTILQRTAKQQLQQQEQTQTSVEQKYPDSFSEIFSINGLRGKFSMPGTKFVFAVYTMPKCPTCIKFVPLLAKWIAKVTNEDEFKSFQFARIDTQDKKNADLTVFSQIRSCPSVGLFWIEPPSTEPGILTTTTQSTNPMTSDMPVQGHLCLKRMNIPFDWIQESPFRSALRILMKQDLKTMKSDDLTQQFPPWTKEELERNARIQKQRQEQAEQKHRDLMEKQHAEMVQNSEAKLNEDLTDEKEKDEKIQDAEAKQEAALTPPSSPESEQLDGVDVTWSQIIVSILLGIIIVVVFGVIIAELWNFIMPRLCKGSVKRINWLTALCGYVLCTLLIKS